MEPTRQIERRAAESQERSDARRRALEDRERQRLLPRERHVWAEVTMILLVVTSLLCCLYAFNPDWTL